MAGDKLFTYRIYGMKLISDREFLHLLSEEKAQALDKEEGVDNSSIPTIYLKKGVPDKIRALEPRKWDFGETESYLSNNTCWIYIHNSEEICYELRPEGLDSRLNTFLLGFGMAFLAIQRGFIPVHSSCLLKDGKAVLISGDSGAGKSTTTAAYIEKGYTLMADDITFVGPDENGNPMAYPAFPYQKLCRNEVEKRHEGEEGLIYIDDDRDKFLVPWRGYYTPNPRPVKAIIYLLKLYCDNVRAEEVKGFNKYAVLTRSIYMRMLVGDYVNSKEIGSKLLWLASKTPVITVERPFEKDTIDEVVSKTFDIIENLI